MDSLIAFAFQKGPLHKYFGILNDQYYAFILNVRFLKSFLYDIFNNCTLNFIKIRFDYEKLNGKKCFFSEISFS